MLSIILQFEQFAWAYLPFQDILWLFIFTTSQNTDFFYLQET